MTDLDVLLARFIEEWNAGRRPAVEDFLSRANEVERDELADQISTFLAFAPTPRFEEDDDRRAPVGLSCGCCCSGICCRSRSLAHAASSPARAGRVVAPRSRHAGTERQRARRRRPRQDRTAARRDGARRTRCDEASQRGSSTCSGSVLGMNSADLARIGMPAAAAGALYRREAGREVDEGLDLLADGLAAPVPEGEWDEVDELFFGRR